MKVIEQALAAGKTNFVLVGEAGCGKSEIALNLAVYLAEKSEKQVHLFDMDMTKPLFRSRDLNDHEALKNVVVHYEEQFFDAPTTVGGVRELLADPNCLVVMDVGGDDIGARSIGGFMLGVDRTSLFVMYVLNYYRPFCQDLEHIDQFLGEILHVSHLRLEDIHFVDNPNAGISTSVEEVLQGAKEMQSMLSEYRDVEMVCTKEDLVPEVQAEISKDQIMPIHLYLTYEWLRA